MKPENIDGALLSPGHPLYAAVDELLCLDLKGVVGGTAKYIDPLTKDPYRLHVYEVELEGESLGDPSEPPRTRPVHAQLVVVQETREGDLKPAQPDILHDLTPVAVKAPFPEMGPLEVARPDTLSKIEGWIRAKVQLPLIKKHSVRRKDDVQIRREFIEGAFKASINSAQRTWSRLQARVMGGDKDAVLARNEALKRVDELKATRAHRLRSLDHMAIVRGGRVAHLGSALVAPAPSGCGMQTDYEVEAIAMEIATRYEEKVREWTVEDISKRMDGSGFDLRSVSSPNEHGVRAVRRIEVKGRAQYGGFVHLTPNEWRQAQRLADTYWLYVVWGCRTGKPILKTIADPWTKFRSQAQKIVEVMGFRISVDVLQSADGEEWDA